MNSKFLLHGGNTSLSVGTNFDYFRLMASPFLKHTLKVLVLPFASFPWPEEVAKKTPEEMKWMTALASQMQSSLVSTLRWINPHKKFINTPPGTLTDRLVNSDIIFAEGGNGDKLQAYFDGIDLVDIVSRDKVCAGASAGANMWVRRYYSNDNAKVCEGLDVVPILTMCHWNFFKMSQLNTLIADNVEGLEVFPLPDEGYVEYDLD